MEQKYCWAAQHVTKPYEVSTSPALKDSAGRLAATFKQTEELIRKSAFPELPVDNSHRPINQLESSYKLVTKDLVHKALFTPSVKKYPSLEMLNFGASRLLWSWEANRVVSLIKHCIRVWYHSHPRKEAKGILLRMPNNLDYTLAKSFRFTSLLKCLGKVFQKVVSELL